MKTYEKKEYEPKKVGSTFWWDVFGWQVLLAIISALILSLGVFLPVYTIYQNNLSDKLMNDEIELLDYFTKLTNFNNIASIIVSIVGIFLAIVFVVVSLKIAIKKIRQRAIIRRDMIPDIMKKFNSNTYICIGLATVSVINSDFIQEPAIVSGIITLISYALQTYIQIRLARKLLEQSVTEQVESPIQMPIA